MKQNWFPALNDALDSENLVSSWPLGVNIGYGETVAVTADYLYISVARDQDGRYERPVFYHTHMENGQVFRSTFA